METRSINVFTSESFVTLNPMFCRRQTVRHKHTADFAFEYTQTLYAVLKVHILKETVPSTFPLTAGRHEPAQCLSQTAGRWTHRGHRLPLLKPSWMAGCLSYPPWCNKETGVGLPVCKSGTFDELPITLLYYSLATEWLFFFFRSMLNAFGLMEHLDKIDCFATSQGKSETPLEGPDA